MCQSDVTFIAVPPGELIAVADQVLRFKPKHTTATDCTSVKGDIVKWLKRNKDTMFVPGHPMAGHEKSGPQFASGWMFRGAKWILTPVPRTYSGAVQAVEALAKEMGATPVRVKAEKHDREVALLSHLPHALAAVLVKLAAKLDSTEASAGSWKDLTRVGGVDPQLWSQILCSNREEVVRALQEFQVGLGELESYLSEGKDAEVTQFLMEAQAAKGKHR